MRDETRRYQAGQAVRITPDHPTPRAAGKLAVILHLRPSGNPVVRVKGYYAPGRSRDIVVSPDEIAPTTPRVPA